MASGSQASLPDSSRMALRSFEFENKISEIHEADLMYRYDDARNRQLLDERPWANNPTYFKKVKVSALALLKMMMHARQGKTLEVMGLLQGKIELNTMIVMDVFALPVEGTETRVNPQEEAYNYMFSYPDFCKRVGRMENVIGWYHSHPGFGCWLSGVDVTTQLINQEGQDPFLAIVIDPLRTVSAGKVELGAFRCYPRGSLPPEHAMSEYQTIPLDKIEDFGVHVKSYYALDVSYFKSSLDQALLESLWHKYWINALAASPLLLNVEYSTKQMGDLTRKLEQVETMMSRSSGFQGDKRKDEDQLCKCARDSAKVTMETVHGLVTHLLQDAIFNNPSTNSTTNNTNA